MQAEEGLQLRSSLPTRWPDLPEISAQQLSCVGLASQPDDVGDLSAGGSHICRVVRGDGKDTSADALDVLLSSQDGIRNHCSSLPFMLSVILNQ